MKIRPLFYSLVLLVVFMLPAPMVWAQTAPSSQPQAAVIDTAFVELSFPEGSPACLSVDVVPDTLRFGLAGSLKLEFADKTFKPAVEEIQISAPWLKLSENTKIAKSEQVVFDVFAYRLNPFQIKIGSVDGPVISVAKSTSDLSETAAIRMPRLWGTRWWILVLPALMMTALIMGIWWLWMRRTRLEPLEQWEPSAPAWLQVSVDLRALMEDDYPDLRTSRKFLDQLATICRSYLGGRYLVHAAEMTSGEILKSCLLKGHDSRSLRNMVKILQTLDHNRYNPEPPSGSWCHAQAGELVASIGEVRILPQYTHVEAALLLDGEKAWTWLNQPENGGLV